MRRRTDGSDSSAGEPPFEIDRRELDAQTSVVSVRGELDLPTAPQLKWALLDALQAGVSQLVLDLSRTSFMDSTALGVLIGVNRSLGPDRRLALVGVSSNVLRVFELSGMDRAFSIYPTLEDALVHLSGRAAEAG